MLSEQGEGILRALTREIHSEKKYHRPIRAPLISNCFATLRSASFFSSWEMLSLTILWSRSWFRFLFRLFLRRSFPVRPVSSSSWRSSSDSPSSSTSLSRKGSSSLLSSGIFPSSSSTGPSIDCDLGLCDRLLAELAGLMRLLLRRRWPEGVTDSISMSPGSRPAPEDCGLSGIPGSDTGATVDGHSAWELRAGVVSCRPEMVVIDVGETGSREGDGLESLSVGADGVGRFEDGTFDGRGFKRREPSPDR